VPVDNLFASPIVINYLKNNTTDNSVVVSPDTGGTVRARYLASRINAGLAIIDKRRQKANVSEVMNVIGDVAGKNCILIDDMIDTAGSIAHAATALKDAGALNIDCISTHPVLSSNAAERLENAGFKEIILTNTILMPEEKKLRNMKVLSVAPLFGEAIKRIHKGESVSSLFL
jgi:ribose-phosphate pyrophosphokinase